MVLTLNVCGCSFLFLTIQSRSARKWSLIIFLTVDLLGFEMFGYSFVLEVV